MEVNYESDNELSNSDEEELSEETTDMRQSECKTSGNEEIIVTFESNSHSELLNSKDLPDKIDEVSRKNSLIDCEGSVSSGREFWEGNTTSGVNIKEWRRQQRMVLSEQKSEFQNTKNTDVGKLTEFFKAKESLLSGRDNQPKERSKRNSRPETQTEAIGTSKISYEENKVGDEQDIDPQVIENHEIKADLSAETLEENVLLSGITNTEDAVDMALHETNSSYKNVTEFSSLSDPGKSISTEPNISPHDVNKKAFYAAMLSTDESEIENENICPLQSSDTIVSDETVKPNDTQEEITSKAIVAESPSNSVVESVSSPNDEFFDCFSLISDGPAEPALLASSQKMGKPSTAIIHKQSTGTGGEIGKIHKSQTGTSSETGKVGEQELILTQKADCVKSESVDKNDNKERNGDGEESQKRSSLVAQKKDFWNKKIAKQEVNNAAEILDIDSDGTMKMHDIKSRNTDGKTNILSSQTINGMDNIVPPSSENDKPLVVQHQETQVDSESKELTTPPPSGLVSSIKGFWDSMFSSKEVDASSTHNNKELYSQDAVDGENKRKEERGDNDFLQLDKIQSTEMTKALPLPEKQLECIESDTSLKDSSSNKSLVAQKKGFWDDYIAKREQTLRETEKITKKAGHKNTPFNENLMSNTCDDRNEDQQQHPLSEITESKTSLGRKLSITIKKGTVKASQQIYETSKEDNYIKWRNRKNVSVLRATHTRKYAPSSPNKGCGEKKANITVQPKTLKTSTMRKTAISPASTDEILQNSRVSSPLSDKEQTSSAEEEGSGKVKRKISIKIQKGMVQQYKTHWEKKNHKTGFWTWKRHRLEDSYSKIVSPIRRKPSPVFKKHLTPKISVNYHQDQHSSQVMPDTWEEKQSLDVCEGKKFWEQERYRTPTPSSTPERPLTPEETDEYMRGFRGKVAFERQRFDSLGSVISTGSADSLDKLDGNLDLEPVLKKQSPRSQKSQVDKEYVDLIVGKVSKQKSLWETKSRQNIICEKSKISPKTTKKMSPINSKNIRSSKGSSDLTAKELSQEEHHTRKECLVYILHSTIEGDLVLETVNDQYLNKVTPTEDVKSEVTLSYTDIKSIKEKFTSHHDQAEQERPARRKKKGHQDLKTSAENAEICPQKEDSTVTTSEKSIVENAQSSINGDLSSTENLQDQLENIRDDISEGQSETSDIENYRFNFRKACRFFESEGTDSYTMKSDKKSSSVDSIVSLTAEVRDKPEDHSQLEIPDISVESSEEISKSENDQMNDTNDNIPEIDIRDGNECNSHEESYEDLESEEEIERKRTKYQLIDHGCQTDDELDDEDYIHQNSRSNHRNWTISDGKQRNISSCCDQEIQVSAYDLINPLKRPHSKARHYDILEIPSSKRRIYKRHRKSPPLLRSSSLPSSDSKEKLNEISQTTTEFIIINSNSETVKSSWANRINQRDFGITNPSPLVASLMDLARDLPSAYPDMQLEPQTSDDFADLDHDVFQHFPGGEVIETLSGCYRGEFPHVPVKGRLCYVRDQRIGHQDLQDLISLKDLRRASLPGVLALLPTSEDIKQEPQTEIVDNVSCQLISTSSVIKRRTSSSENSISQCSSSENGNASASGDSMKVHVDSDLETAETSISSSLVPSTSICETCIPEECNDDVEEDKFEEINVLEERCSKQMCRAYGTGLCQGKVDRVNSFIIDTAGAEEGEVTIKVEGPFEGSVLGTEVYPSEETSGIYEVQFQVGVPANYSIVIMWSEDHIPGSPFNCVVDS